MDQSMMEMVAEAKSMVPAIAPEEAAKLMAAGDAVVVDVRNDGEVAQSGKIAGALHVPLDQFVNIFATVVNKDKVILLYCASGGRAALAGKILLENGYTDVRNLGGFSGWAESGGAVEQI
ncbi:MAG: rhodanese-like domain-containing protein [Proteobacteria bacterium]|nr:rhodanese-like domain-containing protein [Pseudomonadota bacterium]MDA1354915.1 rhodanese-like domain-containing protein [Pseudomonadota bacterium]